MSTRAITTESMRGHLSAGRATAESSACSLMEERYGSRIGRGCAESRESVFEGTAVRVNCAPPVNCDPLRDDLARHGSAATLALLSCRPRQPRVVRVGATATVHGHVNGARLRATQGSCARAHAAVPQWRDRERSHSSFPARSSRTGAPSIAGIARRRRSPMSFRLPGM